MNMVPCMNLEETTRLVTAEEPQKNLLADTGFLGWDFAYHATMWQQLCLSPNLIQGLN
jgi:hypothetical protein